MNLHDKRSKKRYDLEMEVKFLNRKIKIYGTRIKYIKNELKRLRDIMSL